MKSLVPQALGKNYVDFVTFLPPPRIADTRAHRSIGVSGLFADLRSDDERHMRRLGQFDACCKRDKAIFRRMCANVGLVDISTNSGFFEHPPQRDYCWKNANT